ncbi:flagellar FlbD family protein [Blastococcus mobilis]|uniref:Uncharacterized protein YlzI, FlbEa/FlbD family n=1 Tax=Blastococcus mobilis TaxID=1938746 RepID=A0A238YPN5_9ACTN|nr:flagellar FlbD family protein [Blastococcus mobilis]SNR72661.1 Uncharacterized protein YlzI, FlbEa/FlbD family [Blastococcus mobilis]
MIAVTCRNGEHFSIDPVHIERVETDPDTVIHLVDRTKYVVDQGFDELLRTIQDHRASVLVLQKRLAGGTAEIADHASTVRNSSLRLERRQYSRDDGPDYSPVVPPAGADGD